MKKENGLPSTTISSRRTPRGVAASARASTRRYTTVELIVDEKELLGGYTDVQQPHRQYPNTMVSVRVGYEEVGLRGQIKQAGGQWDPQAKLWRIPYHKAMAIGLSDRIVQEQDE